MKVGLKNLITAKYKCGFCATEDHGLCPGGVLNGNETDVVLCGCDCRPLEAKYRCLRCNSRDGINPQTWNCADVATCTLTVGRRASEEHDRLYAPQDTEKPPAGKGDTTTTHPRPKTKTRDCLCGCSNQTKGGLFLPGHDSKYLSAAVTEIREGTRNLADVLDEWRESGVSEALQTKLTKRCSTNGKE